MRTKFASLFAVIALNSSLLAAPPLDRVLPADTIEFAMAPDLAKLEAGFDQSQYGKLWKEPALQAFRRDATTEMVGWVELPGRLGFTWENILSILSGECACATFPIPGPRIGRVAMFDCTGKGDAVNIRLAAAAQKAQQTGGSAQNKTIAGLQVQVFDVPGGKPGTRMQIGAARKDNVLILMEPPESLEKLVPSWDGPPQNSFAASRSYQSIRQRTVMRPGEPTHFVWYVDPFGSQAIMRQTGLKKKQTKGGGEVMRREGFAAVKAVGGCFGFCSREADFVVRMSVYAPNPAGYFGSFRMLSFMPSDNLLPPAWVPGDISSCALARMNIRASFDAFASLFDELAADGEKGTFEEVLATIKKKPGVDLRAEFVDQLVNDIVAFTDWQAPLTYKSVRGMATAVTKNPQVVSAALARSMRTDPKVTKRTLFGAESWEVKAEPKPRKPGEPPPPPSPDAALCVAQNRLNISTNASMLDKVLKPQDRPVLVQREDYQRVKAMWEQLAGKTACMRFFSRTSEDFRVPYEMWRTNQLKKAESIYCQLLALWVKNGSMPMDGYKLPDYSKIGPYFGPVGIQGMNHADGWDLVGFTLKP